MPKYGAGGAVCPNRTKCLGVDLQREESPGERAVTSWAWPKADLLKPSCPQGSPRRQWVQIWCHLLSGAPLSSSVKEGPS